MTSAIPAISTIPTTLTAALLVLALGGCTRERPREDPFERSIKEMIKEMNGEYVEDIPGLKRLCAGGDTIECSDLARKLRQADRHAEAAKVLEGLCARPNNEADCAELAELYREGGGGLERQPKKALAIYRKLYREGAYLYWDRLAWFYDRGIIVKKDPERAWQIHTAACKRGNNVSCWVLGTAYREGKRVKADRARAYAFFRQACKVPPDGIGCKEAAELRPRPRGRARPR
jgi:TPR repeat protein